MCLICNRINLIHNGKGPVWWYPMEKMFNEDNRPSDEKLEKMKRQLSAEPEKLL